MHVFLVRCFQSLRILVLSVVVFAAPCFASGPAEPAFNLTEVAPGVFVHRGELADLDNEARGDSANIGFVVGARCIAVIDSGGSLATGRALRDAIRQRSDLPVCYVINTHVHFDHMLGNAAFRGDETVFVGHGNLAAAVAANREFFVEEFPAELDGSDATAVIAPTTGVSDELRLDLGDRFLRINAHAVAHTNADVTVFDERTSSLFSGDLVFMERLPILDGSLRGWLAWIENFADEPIERVIPGHGPVSAPWPEAVLAEKRYLSTLLSDGRAAIAEGVFLEDAMETMSREAAQPWALNERHPRNVSRAYRELEWE